MTGRDQPLSNIEYEYLRAYIIRKNELEAEANDPKKNKSGRKVAEPQITKRTMGSQQ